VKDTSLFALKGIDLYHLFQHHPDQYAIVFLNIARDGSERSTKNIPLSHISLKHCRAKTRLTPGEIALRRHRIWDEHGNTSDIKKNANFRGVKWMYQKWRSMGHRLERP
jgi:hypothetical protein